MFVLSTYYWSGLVFLCFCVLIWYRKKMYIMYLFIADVFIHSDLQLREHWIFCVRKKTCFVNDDTDVCWKSGFLRVGFPLISRLKPQTNSYTASFIIRLRFISRNIWKCVQITQINTHLELFNYWFIYITLFKRHFIQSKHDKQYVVRGNNKYDI